MRGKFVGYKIIILLILSTQNFFFFWGGGVIVYLTIVLSLYVLHDFFTLQMIAHKNQKQYFNSLKVQVIFVVIFV